MWLIVAGVLAALGLLLAVLIVDSMGGRFAWLTPAQTEHAFKPRRLDQWKDKARTWVAHVLKRSPAPQPSGVRIGLVMMVVRSGLTFPTLGSPTATNAAGGQVWVLNEAEYDAFRPVADGTPGRTSGYEPTLEPLPNTVARIMLATPFPAVPASQPPAAPGNANPNTGQEIKMLPIFLPGETRLVVMCNATDFGGWTVSNNASMPVVKTNFWLACRAMVPEDGGVVIYASETNGPSPSGYLFLVSPFLVDAKGKRISH